MFFFSVWFKVPLIISEKGEEKEEEDENVEFDWRM